MNSVDLSATRFLQVNPLAQGAIELVLNRPEVHNAFNDEMIAELQAVFNQLAHDDQVRSLILKANGRHFSAGADLGWMRRMANHSYQDNLQDASELAKMLQALNEFPKPTIAIVQGAAYGGAVGLVACCDMVIATPKAQFCLSEVKLGLVPAVISPYVIQAMGARAARRYFLSAETIDVETAEQLGLVHLVAQPEELPAITERLCQRYSSNGPEAMKAAKQLIHQVVNMPIGPALTEYTQQLIADIRASAEGKEGLSAFLEKRKPAWQEESQHV
ncbi:enoyl-CoA hydratase/isomerase family protein [Spartinivicinus poritis]|uniref:Enoyl-CoA hydratase/isomerase family protein n=1 Tax=Spartinivicinus poritis TaxID=2994640 RepID=A0ABT5U8E9_9GAMM|nr:enoyl-CoA hydratase/isomerase family protein [Spartinivicinus sp. A2-2]MDE1462639.1 enoyl-CoA hydratase/isomerase family protein [Spartinivicinus sp. A2-2]